MITLPFYVPEDIITEDGDSTRCRSTDGIVEMIHRQYHIAKDRAGTLYIYNNGVFIPWGEKAAEWIYRRVLQRLNLSSLLKRKIASEVTWTLGIDAITLPELPEMPVFNKPWYLNVANGMVNILTKELVPHSPKFLSIIQLPVAYKQSATCYTWEDFIKEVFPMDSQMVPWEIIAWLMVPYRNIKKVTLLYGKGNNGKSVFLNALQSFLGSENVVNIPLQDFEYDRFATARLINKLVNIYNDLPNLKLRTVGKLKALAGGGDNVRTEDKFRNSNNVPLFARHIFATNELPEVRDDSGAFFDRVQILLMTGEFKNDPKEHDRLRIGLSNPFQLSGVLNKALSVLPGVLENGITETPSMQNTVLNYQEENHPLGKWLAKKTRSNPSKWTSRNSLYASYEDFMSLMDCKLLSRKTFFKVLTTFRKDLEDKQVRSHGATRDTAPLRGYKGIELI